MQPWPVRSPGSKTEKCLCTVHTAVATRAWVDTWNRTATPNAMEVGVRVRLLVCAVVVGERACHVPASRSCSGPCSPSTHPAAAISVSCSNGMAFTASPRTHIASSHRRVTWLSSKPSLLRPRDIGAGAVQQRRPSSVASDKDRAELPWSGPTINEAFDQGNTDNGNKSREERDDTGVPGQQQPGASCWSSEMWEGDWEGDWDDMTTSREGGDETGSPLPPTGVPGRVRVGSQEFTDLVTAQFDVLATVLTEVSEIVLFTRQENSETGSFEFVPALEYPESEDGAQLREEPEDLPSTGNAVDALSDSGMPVQNMAGQLNPPKTVENDDGSLSAPIVYASVVMGMITVWGEKRNQARQAFSGEGSGDEPVLAGAKTTATNRISWDDRDKKVLEKVVSSVAMAAVLDQKQRWAAVMQVQQLRGVIAESLHQVKNPMTALRTFGKLLLRRLPPDDTLNRELAKDILLQSDRVVDLLLPIDAVIGLLGQAVDTADTAATSVAGATSIAGGGMLPQLEGLPGAAPAPASSSTSTSTVTGGEWTEPFSSRGKGQAAGSVPWSVSQEVQDALLSASPSEDLTEARVSVASAGPEAPPAAISVPVSLVSVQDVVGKVAVAAEADAEARRVCFRWSVDDALPDVLGCAGALEEALSIVLEKTIQYHEMVGGRQSDKDKTMVELTARTCTQAEWGAHGGVIIGVTGKNGQETDAYNIPHTLDKGYTLDEGDTLDQGCGDRKTVDSAAGAVDSAVGAVDSAVGAVDSAAGAVDSAVGARLEMDLGTAADLMRSCGGDMIVANKDERGWGSKVMLFLPSHRKGLEQ